MSASDCPACRQTWPERDHVIERAMPADLYLHDDQFFPGWCVLVLNRHAVELYELTAPERHAFIDQAARTARALTRVFGAVKVNYELLGNQLPHLHWHLIPRRHDDPAPRDPVWTVSHGRKRVTGEELERAVEAIRQALAAGG